MWNFKEFKTESKRNNWIDKNSSKFQIEIIFVNNSYAVEFKKKKVIDIL